MKHVFGFSQLVRLFAALTLVLGALVLTASSASAAATLTVTKTADTNDGACDADCSLREAIAASSAGDTIRFAASLAGNTIRLGSQLMIAQNLTIDGTGLNPQVTVSGDTDNNGAGDVGVFYVNTGVTFNLSNLTVSKGYATNGAGIYHNGATLVITNSTFSDNNASSSGGGIFSYSVLIITNSTFAGNSATNGAAIMNGGTLTVANSTFSNNSASSAGGGIYNSGGPVNITNSTFSANSAGATFGGGIHNSGSATLRNTIIANSASGGNCNGSVTDGGGNLVWGDTTCPGVNTDPNLGALAANGGPTQTFALLAGSPAINAGDDTICGAAPVNNLDQRGFARGLNGPHCDIGAYEYQDSTAPTVSMSSAALNPTNSSPISVTVQFSETVTGFIAGDITPGNGAVGNFVAVDGDTYTFDLTPSGQGLVTADIAADAAFDSAGNGNTAATQFSRTYDTVGPTVTMSSAASNPTNTSPIPVTVTFNESVTGFLATDIVPANGTVGNFAGTGASYTFDLTPSGQGLVTADIAAGVASDSAGNGNTIATQFSRTYDSLPPTVTMTSLASDPTNTSPIAVTVQFSETVTGFSAGNILPGNGTVSNFTAVDGDTYTFDLIPSAPGVVTADIAAGAAFDSAGNGNMLATQFSRTFTIVYNLFLPLVVR
jgi:CSLREA domain-containing protein